MGKIVIDAAHLKFLLFCKKVILKVLLHRLQSFFKVNINKSSSATRKARYDNSIPAYLTCCNIRARADELKPGPVLALLVDEPVVVDCSQCTSNSLFGG